MKKIFTKINILRWVLMIGSLAAILLVMPKADHQSFSYELNQPWKYPLLTAPFDMPILRDSASLTSLRDSVNKNFVPFAKRNPKIADINIARFRTIAAASMPASEASIVTGLLAEVYSHGVIDQQVYEEMSAGSSKKLRMAPDSASQQGASVITIDASDMFSPMAAYKYIDSAYSARNQSPDRNFSSEIGKALNTCLVPNILLDSMADSKYREQEFLNITGALGVIKTGQRIVDRGEIITPQIFTNLNTYQEIQARQQGDNGPTTYYQVGQGLLILMIFILLYAYLSLYRQTFFSSLRKMTFLMTFITLFVIFAILMFEQFNNGLYLVPFAAVPVITLIFFDSRTAIFALLTTIMISATVATFPFAFIFMELVVGLTATFSIRQLSRRSQLLRTAIFAFIGYCVTYFISCLFFDGDLSNFSLSIIGSFGINSVLLSFAYVLIVLFERIFGFTSTVTLVELSDINNKLLRRLAEEAPGTFQHSMQVSTLASEAARAINANTQLVRTGALYHDIGKMKSPIFFTENQHGVNPHEGLDPEVSAKKIIAHVTDGLAMAKAEKLPQVIREFIAEHHGKGMTKYFYTTAVNNAGGKEIDPAPFTYPGPDPQSKETAILMMADAVEAASRSLKDFSQKSINSLVDNIIDCQVREGRFKESPISLKDIETVKDTFKKRLATIYHSRIAYPTIKSK
ncbi:MAG: HDIG domain-containing protein [Prevotella sp.]|nr:HDIG domain-containing protein [Bacteroides sp.]MCM1365748.1 HDIG domain-containing protein [Prevotella sp.]MCM1436418.1 HDIG domain-containing protein [Prevotella sp.]